MDSVIRKLPSDYPSKYCRLCFVEKNLIQLFPGNDGFEHTLIHQISQLIGIQIEPDMDVSSSICWHCAVILEDFQLLRQRSLENDEIIRNSRKGHTVDIVEVKEERDIAEVNFVESVTARFESAATSNSCINGNERSLEMAATANNLNNDLDGKCYEGDNPTSTLCSIDFKTRASLSLHCKEQHSNGARRFQCVFCPAVFKRKGHLERHMETHSGIKRYACMLCCDESFARAKTLARHMRLKHANVPYSTKKTASERASKDVMKCPFCTEKFDCDQLLNTHMKSHKDGLPHVCEICDARFAKMLGLTVHMEVSHRQKLEYLNEHLQTVHEVSMADHENAQSNDLNLSETTSQDEETLHLEFKVEIEEGQMFEEQCD